jgi:hypothetical protein
MKSQKLHIVLLIGCLLGFVGCSHAPRLAECHGKATPVNPQSAIEVSHGARPGR